MGTDKTEGLRQVIEGAVEEEDVDARLAEDVEVSVVSAGCNECGDGSGGEVADAGNAGGLELGVGETDVRVESAGGGRDGVSGDGGVG